MLTCLLITFWRMEVFLFSELELHNNNSFCRAEKPVPCYRKFWKKSSGRGKTWKQIECFVFNICGVFNSHLKMLLKDENSPKLKIKWGIREKVFWNFCMLPWLHIKWSKFFNLNWMQVFLDNWYKGVSFLIEWTLSITGKHFGFIQWKAFCLFQSNKYFFYKLSSKWTESILTVCIPTPCVLLCIWYKSIW